MEPGSRPRRHRHAGCGGEEAEERERYQQTRHWQREICGGGLEVETRVSWSFCGKKNVA